jgi:hypothetical protein
MFTLLTLVALFAPAQLGDHQDAEFSERFTPLTGTSPAQWRVIWTTDPATAATVSWSTAEPGSAHVVHYGSSPAGPDGLPHRQATHRDGAYTRHAGDESTVAHYHHARLTDLAPSTTYYLQLESDGVRSRELHFTTAPTDDRPISILVGGDSRSGWRARCLVNLAMARILTASPSVLAFSHGGDYMMYGDRWDDWSAWLTHNELTTTAAGRVLPVIPTRGNHDYGAPYGEIFDDPGDPDPAYFHTHLSPHVSLLTLNSNISVAGDQLTWLESELAMTNARWRLASYHRPLYPAVKTPGEARAFWPPVFDEYGLDIALESDGHCIKRTMPIRADAPHEEGVVYLGEGGLGVPQRTPRTDDWFLQPPAVVTNGHHVIQLDFSSEELRARILRMPESPGPLDPRNFDVVLAPGSTWRYLADDDAPDDWSAATFDASTWLAGDAGFGYGDEDDTTELSEMRGQHSRLYLRRELDYGRLEDTETLTLMCRYDDAFVAYLNGVEVARAEIEPKDESGERGRVGSHEAKNYEPFALSGWRELVRPGVNVLALVGHNRMLTDRDFTLDPWLAGDPREGVQSGTPPELEVVDDLRLKPRSR